MKNLYIILVLLFATHLYSSNELAWVDEQVEAIKPPRVGLDLKKLSKIRDPFIYLRISSKKKGKRRASTRRAKAPTGSKVKKTVQAKKFKLTLNAIMNKSAMINGKWYHMGDKVYGYELAEVNLNNILLIKKKKKILLSTKSKSINLKSNNK